MATHSSILALRIPWTEEPGGFRPWDCKLDMTATKPPPPPPPSPIGGFTFSFSNNFQKIWVEQNGFLNKQLLTRSLLQNSHTEHALNSCREYSKSSLSTLPFITLPVGTDFPTSTLRFQSSGEVSIFLNSILADVLIHFHCYYPSSNLNQSKGALRLAIGPGQSLLLSI